ncbi:MULTISPECIES: MFS transporter [unclassified Nocardioides]|uniref:MFS transporter n=1 Tax=unclassified Nocardioides TaxID=2615069 RepID=UPI0009F06249|nr:MULTISPECIES: MFS transporter [unclassified Nocardioides]GAW50000.1 major facilitator superfamily protein [Nocardioides sp. PD653-B2]GAW55907.1 major facilitator superfamily protein [Nocardioides sp. PD653]
MTTTASPTTFDRRLVAPMVLGSILNPVNSSIIAVSLIPIGRAFGAAPSRTAWLVSALYLATAVGQPVVGRLIDVLGPRRVYLVATAMVGIAGVIGLVAQDLGTLVGARVLLGLGTCAGYPASMYLIRSEARRTGQDSPAAILTVLAVSAQTIAVLGPSLGGFLIGVGGWRSTFAVNIPLSLACLWLGSRRLPRAEPVRAVREEGPRPRYDVGGVVLFTATLVAGLLFLMEDRLELWPLAVVAVLVGAAFVVVELRVSDPFIDLRLLAGNAPLVATYARSLLTAVVSYTFLYGFTQWLQDGRGLTPSQSGLILIPVFGTAILVSATTGRRPEIRGKLVVGALFQVTACVLLLAVAGDSPVWFLVVIALVLGVPQGLLSLANQNAVYHQADPERVASSAGLLRTATYLGAILAAAANGVFLHDGATTSGMHHLAFFAVVVSALMLIATVADRSLGAVGRPTTQES